MAKEKVFSLIPGMRMQSFYVMEYSRNTILITAYTSEDLSFGHAGLLPLRTDVWQRGIYESIATGHSAALFLA
jgi:hypothetical protein